MSISMVCSLFGSHTRTGWNLRSNAASFSMWRRYSSGVVAPIICISPRPRAGFKILAASMAPSALPAPIMVCSSSMNSMTSPARFTSFKTDFTRSSKSPLYLVPASIAGISSETILFERSSSGASPFTTLSASPSATAVLPTPGSPIRTGLFLVRRDKICTVRRISSPRPTTGSILPAEASSVRSRLYWSRILVSARRTVLRAAPVCAFPLEEGLPNTATTSVYTSFISMPRFRRTPAPPQSLCRSIPSSRCSVPI